MTFLKFSAIIIAFSFLFPKNFSLSDAKRVHNSITTIDTHCDTPMKFVNNGFDIKCFARSS